jgi:polyisoprenoid-binding protein YceI
MKTVQRLITTALLCGTSAYAITSGDSALSLWQIAYTAPTRYADGYTVHGKARSFRGSFRFENGQLLALDGVVPVSSLSSGLSARDASMRELVFHTADGRTPDLEFKAKPASCQPQEKGWVCAVEGSFKIRDEWQPVAGTVHIGEYQGRTWLHAEGTLQLSKYNFYAAGPAALKVADRVDVALDLLGP